MFRLTLEEVHVREVPLSEERYYPNTLNNSHAGGSSSKWIVLPEQFEFSSLRFRIQWILTQSIAQFTHTVMLSTNHQTHTCLSDEASKDLWNIRSTLWCFHLWTMHETDRYISKDPLCMNRLIINFLKK